MKLFFSLLLFTNLIVFSSESPDSIFFESNELYKLEEFQGALDGYLSLVNKEFDNTVLYYNIANCYYKLDKLGYARLYYEKAKLYNPKDKDVNYNLYILQSKLIDDVGVVPEFFLKKWISQINVIFFSFGWSILTLLFLYSSVFLFLFFLFTKTTQNKTFFLKILFVTIPFFLISVSFFVYNVSDKKNTYGVLTSSNTYVKVSPSDMSENHFILHEGVKFQLVDNIGEWTRIILSDGKDGWLLNKDFSIIGK